MQWNAEYNAGFTTGTPWLMVNPNHAAINVSAAEQNPDSVLHFYRKLLRLRADNQTLIYGDFALIERDHPQVFAYTRTLGGEVFTVLCNMSGEDVALSKPISGECVLRNVSGEETQTLLPYEARVIKSIVEAM